MFLVAHQTLQSLLMRTNEADYEFLLNVKKHKIGFGKRGLYRKVHFLEILENLEILEILENPQAVEYKGGSDHLLEILENLEILEIVENAPVKRPLFVMTPFSGPDITSNKSSFYRHFRKGTRQTLLGPWK